MSRHSSSSPPDRPGAQGASKRIDVSSPAAALRQSPFSTLAGLSAPAAATPAGSAEPASAPASVGKHEDKPRSRGRLILRRETKHRGGKTVVVISGFATLRDAREQTLHEVEKHLKARLGCGGASDPERGEVLIQGDRPEAIADLLRALGFDVAGVTAAPKAGRSPR